MYLNIKYKQYFFVNIKTQEHTSNKIILIILILCTIVKNTTMRAFKECRYYYEQNIYNFILLIFFQVPSFSSTSGCGQTILWACLFSAPVQSGYARPQSGQRTSETSVRKPRPTSDVVQR